MIKSEEMNMNIVSDIQIEKIKKSKLPSVDFDNLQFGKVYSDHMFSADYKDGKWQDLKIKPFMCSYTLWTISIRRDESL
jgi:hypothetical protein